MSPLPTVSRQAPQTALARVARAQRATDRRLREAAAKLGDLTNATIRRGILHIIEGGGLVIDGVKIGSPDGDDGATFQQFRWGALPDDPSYNRPDGQRQQGLLVRLDDGTIALSVAELLATDGQYRQAIQMWSRAGDIVVAPDTNSGKGLARPRLTWPTPQPTRLDDWLIHSPASGDTSWTSVARCEPVVENAKMWWNVRTIVDAGVTATYRWCFQLDAGVQAPVGRTHTLVGDDPDVGYRFGFWRETNVDLPDGVTVGTRCTVDLQVQMSAGANGSKVARACVIALGGDQS